MRRTQEVVRLFTVLQTEQRVPVLGPTIGEFVRFAWQQGWEMHFLKPGVIHFFANNFFHVAKDQIAKR